MVRKELVDSLADKADEAWAIVPDLGEQSRDTGALLRSGEVCSLPGCTLRQIGKTHVVERRKSSVFKKGEFAVGET